MNVNNYLEAFLTVYGWEFYYMLYLLLASLGLFLYPVLRSFAGIYIDYLSDTRSNGDEYLAKMLTVGILTTLVFLFSVVPIAPVKLNQFSLKGVCGTEKYEIDKVNGNGKYFAEDKTSIPVLPWIAMMIGQGINNTIYKLTPCAPDVTEGQKAIWNANLDHNKALYTEYERYRNECHVPITNRFKQILDGKFTTKEEQDQQRWLERWIEDLGGKDEQTRNILLNGLDSKLIKEVVYNEKLTSPNGIPVYKYFKAQNPVTGFTGDDGSGQASKDAPPTCKEWWTGQGGKAGLRTRLAEELSFDVVRRLAAKQGGDSLFGKYKRCDPRSSENSDLVTKDKKGQITDFSNQFYQNCRAQLSQVIFSGDDDKLVTRLLNFDQGNFARDDVLSAGEKNNLQDAVAATIVAGIASFILSFFTDVDLTGGVMNTVVSFYASFFMLSLLLKFLLPLILMVIYMFWGIFMVSARLAIDGVIKGMFLIVSLIVMPGIWAVMNHLDDKIWESMHGTEASSMSFDFILLDASFQVIKVAAVFILFYMINLGEGVNPGQVVNSSQSEAKNLSSGLGSTTGRAAGGAARGSFRAIGRGLRRVGRGIKSGLGKIWRGR